MKCVVIRGLGEDHVSEAALYFWKSKDEKLPEVDEESLKIRSKLPGTLAGVFDNWDHILTNLRNDMQDLTNAGYQNIQIAVFHEVPSFLFTTFGDDPEANERSVYKDGDLISGPGVF